jgi:hypothetical protein
VDDKFPKFKVDRLLVLDVSTGKLMNEAEVEVEVEGEREGEMIRLFGKVVVQVDLPLTVGSKTRSC